MATAAMRTGDPQGPTRTGLPNTMGPCQPLEGRWCNARRVPEGLCAWSEEDLIPCGGELLYRRRREEGLIVTYLVCQFCGDKRPMLSCDVETMQHTDLTQDTETERPYRRTCYACGCMKHTADLEYRSLGGGARGLALFCRGGCSPEPATVTLSWRACDFCGRLKLPGELTVGALRGTHGFALGCKGGCPPKGSMQV